LVVASTEADEPAELDKANVDSSKMKNKRHFNLNELF
jgi:hypothetical protein